MFVAVCVMLLAGCANLQTRPGNPDSYNTALFGGKYYEISDLKKLEWPSLVSSSNSSNPSADTKKQVVTLQQIGASIQAPPPVYIASAIPRDIWQARGAAWNMHLKYLAASYKAEEAQDVFAIPLFGTAVATVALSVAKASTVSVAATGLGGGALFAGYSYMHPDKDASADQTAAFALVCVVDQSHPLRTMSVIPLILDRAALRDALELLADDSGELMTLTQPSASDQATQKAVKAAQSAAKLTMANLDLNINLYDNMPTLIYSTVDQIDRTAQFSGVRMIDYSSILSSLQASAANKSAGTTAQSATENAKTKTSTATKTSTSKASQAVTKPTKNTSPQTNLMAVTNNTGNTPNGGAKLNAVAEKQPAGENPDDTTTDPGKSGTNQNKATSLSAALASTTTSDLQKVTDITSDANEDIAEVDYQGVAANIKACPTGQTVAPAITAPSPAPSTDNTDGDGS